MLNVVTGHESLIELKSLDNETDCILIGTVFSDIVDAKTAFLSVLANIARL